MKFNICLVRPTDNVHVLAFWELAELVHFSLLELGHESSLQFQKIEKDATNIVLGVHLLDTAFIPKMPPSTIFINTEQIYLNDASWNKNIFKWAEKFQFWDYSDKNIARFKELGILNVKLLRLGFQKELSRIKKSPQQDIDVLFYGSMNERRYKVLSQLQASGLKVQCLYGSYGTERDQWIGRSKVVLNHHFYRSEIFEIVRVFYLLSNAIAVVAEVNETTSIEQVFNNAIYATPYGGLVACCEKLLLNNADREKVEKNGLEIISKRPQSIFTGQLIN